MQTRSTPRPASHWLLALVLFLSCGIAFAQGEPSLNQVYEAAHAGKLDQAQSMMRQVLAAHPNSAKAHFVEADLLAQQGRLDAARESLARAEKLQPGLAFATPESVSGLRARLNGGGLNGLSGIGRTNSASGPPSVPATRGAPSSPSSSPAPTGSGFGWFWPVLLIGGAVALFLMFRRRAAAARMGGMAGPAYAGQGYGGGPGPAGYPAPAGAGYAPGQPYGQPYAQQQGPGLGSRIAGGLATGAAIGAGMMAAEAIGRSITGHHAGNASGNDAFGAGAGAGGGGEIPSGDLGGDNFGIRDSSGWDDSSSISSGDSGGGGGGDWDS